MHDWCVSIKGHQKFVVPRLIFHSLFKKTERATVAKVQVVWGFGRAGRRARAAGRYGIIWLSRNLRSKLFKLFCCTYLVKRVIELTSEI